LWKKHSSTKIKFGARELDQIAKGDEKEHETKAKALYNICGRCLAFLRILKSIEGTCTGNLEQVVLLKFLEYAAFDFDKLIGHE
jgi:hypothetical protein